MCKISVIAPVYNMEKYIDQFLNSLRQQTLDDFEVILVDDGSKDSSPDTLDKFKEDFPKCTVIHKENGGVCSARNRGIREARGEYLYIVDSDDWLSSNALLHLWRAAEETKADIIYGQNYIEYDHATELEKLFPSAFVTENKESLKEIQCALNNKNLIKASSPDFEYIDHLGGAPWKAMVRRKLVRDNGILYDETLVLGEDILFWQNVYDYAARVAYIAVPIYHYRVTQNSLFHGYKPKLLDTYRHIFDVEEEYLRSTDKDQDHWNAYYFRVLIQIHLAMGFLFQHPDNPSENCYQDFVNTIKQSPYKEAIQKVPLDKLLSKKSKLGIMLLRQKQYRLYWLLKKHT